jgi:hypothetical protein
VEETPDPLGKCWVTPTQAQKLYDRVSSAARPDPALLTALLDLLSYGESQPELEQP